MKFGSSFKKEELKKYAFCWGTGIIKKSNCNSNSIAWEAALFHCQFSKMVNFHHSNARKFYLLRAVTILKNSTFSNKQ